MHRLLLEPFVVMTAEAEVGLVSSNSKKEAVGRPVRIMAGSTIAILDRGMDHFLFAHHIMALVTERRSLLNQFETFPTLERMLCCCLGVAGETLPISGWLVALREIANGGMAVGRLTGISTRFGREQREKAKNRDKEEG
jgi:hypothetical protein